jgi:amino acid transporter
MPDKRFRIFQRLVGLPYLLALLGLLMPMASVSCTDQVIAEPSIYEIALGYDLETELREPASSLLKRMEEGNPRSIERFKDFIPNFPKMEPVFPLFGIAGALVIAAIFAFISPLGYYASLGSLAMGMLSMFSLWVLLSQVGAFCNTIGMNVLKVEPAAGAYCASVLILIGTAMNLACIARPIVDGLRAKRANKK